LRAGAIAIVRIILFFRGRNGVHELLDLRRPDEQVNIGLPQAALLDSNQAASFQPFHVISRLSLGNAEACPQTSGFVCSGSVSLRHRPVWPTRQLEFPTSPPAGNVPQHDQK
jgi:hypothetical protein